MPELRDPAQVVAGSLLTDATVTAAKVALDVATQAELDAAVQALPSLEDGAFISWDETVPGIVTPKGPTIQRSQALAGAGQVINSVAETNLTATHTFPANTLKLGTLIHVTIGGTLTNNTGAVATTTIRVKIGGATVASVAFTAVPASATERAWRLDLPMFIFEFIGAPYILGTGLVTLSDTAGGNDLTNRTFKSTLTALTLTASNAFVVTAQHGAAATTLIAANSVCVVRQSDTT